MDKDIITAEIVVIVGALSAVALYMGQVELAAVGLGGLVGFISQNKLNEIKE